MLKIYSDKEKILHQKCENIELPISDHDFELAKNMLQHLRESQDPNFSKKYNIRSGIGLAAPQVGECKRMFAILLDDENKHYEFVLANPKIINRSIKMCYLSGGEGCLSVNGRHEGNIRRNYKIKITGYNVLEKQNVTFEATGYLSIALQHEYDHLDGILFYQHINPFNPYLTEKGDVEI